MSPWAPQLGLGHIQGECWHSVLLSTKKSTFDENLQFSGHPWRQSTILCVFIVFLLQPSFSIHSPWRALSRWSLAPLPPSITRHCISPAPAISHMFRILFSFLSLPSQNFCTWVPADLHVTYCTRAPIADLGEVDVFKPWIVLPLWFPAGSLACNFKNFSDILQPHLKTIPSRLRYYSSVLIGRFTFEWTWGSTQYPERTGRGLLTNPGLCHLTVLPPPMKGFLRSQFRPADMPIAHSHFAPSQYLPLYRMVKRLWGNEVQAPRHWTVHALPETPKNTFQIAVYSLIISLDLILDNPWDKNKFCLKYSCFSGLEPGKCSRNYTFGWCDSKFIEKLRYFFLEN